LFSRLDTARSASAASAAHAPIDVRRVRPDDREFGDKRVMGSEVAHRVRCGGIAGEREGLAATAAEIELAARAACARLLHPRGAAEGIEGRVIPPVIGERSLAHVPEFEAGYRLGGMTGQHFARRSPVEQTAAPTADARLWIAGVIVRHHRVDDDAAVVTRP